MKPSMKIKTTPRLQRCSTAGRTPSLIIIIFAFGCLALSPTPKAFGVVPAPDGGYPGGNTAEGQTALLSLTTGGYNTAVGFFSLRSNSTNSFNTAIGAGTLLANTADGNTAVGAGALLGNSSGTSNTAVGEFALAHNTIGTGNVGIGDNAGLNATGDRNVYIGRGVVGVAGESDHTYIRNINTTNVSGVSADFVEVDLTTGLLGRANSSRRYKEDIKPMDKASEALYRLKPVTYHFKKEIDPSRSLEYGLVAEDVAQVDPNLAIRDGKGQIESVRYMAVNAMLLNEFLKEHRKVGELQATIGQQKKDSEATAARQQKEIQALTASLREQASQIQKVSAQLAAASPSRDGLKMGKFARRTAGRICRGGPSPRTVLNDQ